MSWAERIRRVRIQQERTFAREKQEQDALLIYEADINHARRSIAKRAVRETLRNVPPLPTLRRVFAGSRSPQPKAA